MANSNPLLDGHKPLNSNGGSLGTNETSRRNAIIGVCVAFGALGLLVTVWWLVRAITRHQGVAHQPLVGGGADYGSMAQVQPLGPGSSAAATRAFSPDNDIQNPFASPPGTIDGHDGAGHVAGGVHRRSFFFAEDELRGYEGANREIDSDSPPPASTATSGTTYYSSHRPVSTYRRGQITPGVISAPILRESSLNW